jgi:hypothetical protein
MNGTHIASEMVLIILPEISMNCRNISLEDICILSEDTILKIDCIMGVQLKVLYGINEE